MFSLFLSQTLPLGAILHGVPPVNMSVAAPNMSNRPSHCKEEIGKKILCMQFKRHIDLQFRNTQNQLSFHAPVEHGIAHRVCRFPQH